MLIKCFSFIGLCLVVSFQAFAQTTNTKKWRKTENDSMQNALYLFEDSKYVMALPIYEKLYESHSDEMYLKYCYGKCALYRSDKHEVATTLLSEIYEKNKKVADIEYDLARAKHYNYKFDEAIALIEKYISRKKIDPVLRKEALQLKQYCINAKAFYAVTTEASITNAGSIINTEYNESMPVISADESTIVYTYNGIQSLGGLQNDIMQPDRHGKYYDDVFVSYKEDGVWIKPVPIRTINTNGHEAAIALSADGSYLFTYKDTADGHGDIYLSHRVNGNWTIPERLKGDVNSYSWEGSCSITTDGKYLYFSSERSGGYGGKDIYRATLLSDSSWGRVINLGDSINTPFDDDSPFIHPDGVTLFYSSKGKNSMGDYDVFQTRLNRVDSTFSSPVNLGFPINTPDADYHYVLSANSETGYYASGKSDGYGLQDLYLVNQGYVGKKPSLCLVKGKIMSDGQPVESYVTVNTTSTDNKQYRTFRSNNNDGRYLFILPADAEYVLTYTYKSFPKKMVTVNTTHIDGYKEELIDVNFNTGDTLQSKIVIDSQKTNALATAKPLTIAPTEKKVVSTKQDEFVPRNAIQAKTKEYSEKYGNISVEGLEFKIQIAAYKSPRNYDYDHLKKLGKIQELLLADGIIRLTIGGSFKTLAQAFEFNKKVVNAGQKDAFVTVLFNGKRVFLEELERMGIYIQK